MVCSEAYWRKSGCARSDAGVESQPHLPPALLVLGTSAVALHCPGLLAHRCRKSRS